MNIERGDTFIVMEEMHRGNHFTCVGVGDEYFYAGDTNGRMWKFKQSEGHTYQPYIERAQTWSRRSRIDAENIVEE